MDLISAENQHPIRPEGGTRWRLTLIVVIVALGVAGWYLYEEQQRDLQVQEREEQERREEVRRAHQRQVQRAAAERREAAAKEQAAENRLDRTVDAALTMLGDEDPEIRGEGREALIRIGVDAIPALTKVVEETGEEDPVLKREAIETLRIIVKRHESVGREE